VGLKEIAVIPSSGVVQDVIVALWIHFGPVKVWFMMSLVPVRLNDGALL
jgi:hypothetical protein